MQYNPYNPQPQPQPKKETSLWAMIGGGILIALAVMLMFLGVAAKVAFRTMARHSANASYQDNLSKQRQLLAPPKINTSFSGRQLARSAPAKFVFQSPSSLDESISFLKSRDFGKMAGAWQWLGDEKTANDEQRSEVCQAMLGAILRYSNDGGRPTGEMPLKDVESAVATWFTKEATADLQNEIRRATMIEGPMQSEVICILAESGGIDMEQHILGAMNTGRLGRRSRGLRDSGPELVPYVLPSFNHPSEKIREEARELLHRWNVDEDQMIKQCVRDMSDTDDQWILGYAVDYLSRHIDKIDEASKPVVAAGVEKTIAKAYRDIDGRTYELLKACYRDPESSAALFEAVKKADRKRIDHRVLELLGNSESEVAIDALMLAWNNQFHQTQAERHLAAINTPLVVKKVSLELNSANTERNQERLLRLLKKLDQSEPAVFDFYCQSLASKNTNSIELSLQWLKKEEFDVDLQPKLSEALAKAATLIIKTDQRFAGDLIEAIEIWGDDAAAEKLVPFLSSRKSFISENAAKALGKMNVPATYPALSKNLYRSSSGFRGPSYSRDAKAALLSIGSDAEEEVLKNLDSLNATDYKNWSTVLGVIGQIGGRKSVTALKKFGRGLDRNSRNYRSQVGALERTLAAIADRK